MGAMRLLQSFVAVAMAMISLSGCGSSAGSSSADSWDMEEIKAQARQHYAVALVEHGERARVKRVDLIRTDSPNVFEGFVTFTDKSTLGLSVKVDPQTGVPIFIEGRRSDVP